MSTISICIPTYGMKGEGGVYLNKNLHSISIQSLQPHEIIISDHSVDDNVQLMAESWSNRLNIKYFRNTDQIGCISANLNNCISRSTGDVIDFMLQDDYYAQTSSLQTRLDTLADKDWSVSATIHYAVEKKVFYWHLIPEYRKDIYLGFNSIGSPSLLTMKRHDAPTFDEKLFMLTDCDYYKQLFDKYGLPNTTDIVTSVSCIWAGQSQNSVTDDKMEMEKEIVREKYERNIN